MPTGFPELDNLLGAGLTSPSCICVSGHHLGQRNFILQLVNNFLQSGRRGLYICLDRPASEVRANFKKLGLDIAVYDNSYDLFFIDFFTYSQNALIETSTLRTLEYTPALLLETITPFLDWIKNGFVIIDTLSTLTLNMNAKEAYEFIRGLKLLGRAFNLIALGITHVPVAEMEPIISNSDGMLQFKEDAIVANRFENVNNETLIISTDKEGKISFKPTLPNLTITQNETSPIAILSATKSLKILPTVNLTPTKEVGCAIDKFMEKVKSLEEQNLVSKTPYCSTVYCSKCNSQTMEVYIQCPECQNRALEKGDILEHFKCGNVGFEVNFQVGNKLVCKKCNTELKQLGVDYRRVGVGYQCINKHVFSIPRISFVCTQCGAQFDAASAKLQTQYSYELTDKGKRQAVQMGYRPE